MNNLHQVGAALSLYQQDYDESFPASRPTARATAGAAVPAHTYYAGRIRTEGAASVPAQTPVEPRRVAPNAAAQPPSDFADGHAVFGRGWVPPATPRAGVKLPPVAKIAPALNQLAAAWRAGTHIAPGPLRVKDGRVEIEVTVDRLPADGPRRLKALGFVVTGKPGSGKQLRGTVPLAKLEQLAALEFVRRVDVPRVTAARR